MQSTNHIRVANLLEAVATTPPPLHTITQRLKQSSKEKPIKKFSLYEDWFPHGSEPLKVDREKNIIYNVKILGWRSKNKNRRYSPSGVDPQLYEGAVVNIDHPEGEAAKGPRPLSARFGDVVGITKTDQGLFARELRYNPKHPLAEQILYMAEHAPHLFGCSQNAFGDVYEDATGEIVETVTDVRSIDLVSEPATTKGLYEGVDDELDPNAFPPGPDDAVPAGAAPPGAAPEEEIPLGGPPVADAPGAPPAGPAVPPAAEGSADSGLDDVGGVPDEFDISDEAMSMLTKIFNAPNMPIQEKKKRIGHVLQICQKHQQQQYEAVMSTKIKTVDDAKKFLMESKDPVVARCGRAVVGTLDKFEVQATMTSKRTLAESLCERAKLPKAAITPHFMRTLVECATEKDMMEAIEDRRQLTGVARSTKPRSADPTVNAALEEQVAIARKTERTPDEQKKLEEAFLADVFKS